MKLEKFEKLNPMAVEVAQSFSNEGVYEIESRYMAAVSSFAVPDVRRLGLLETVIMWHNKGKENEKFSLIPRAILSIAKGENLMGQSKDAIYECYYTNMHSPNRRKFARDISDAATALKYEMRMYEKIDNQKEGQDE